MLEHTRTRHIENCDIFRVVCPSAVVSSVKKYLVRAGCNLEELVAPSDILPERSPATHLRGARHRENMTQRELAEKSGIPRRHISEMENDRRPIGKKNAKLLSEALGVDYRFFL